MAMAAFHEKSSIKCFLERMKIGDAALSYSAYKKYDIKEGCQKESNKEKKNENKEGNQQK
jgi:hypothetical protein